MTADAVLYIVESMGGKLALNGERLHYDLPEEAEPLLDQVRACRDEICRLLIDRQQAPIPPPGVQILTWNLPSLPVIVTNFSVITDVDKFARSTLRQLGHALNQKAWPAGNWSVRDLVERLEQVGVGVEVSPKRHEALRNGGRTMPVKATRTRKWQVPSEDQGGGSCATPAIKSNRAANLSAFCSLSAQNPKTTKRVQTQFFSNNPRN